MAIPNKVTSADQIQDGFRKLNQTIDNIPTGLTYTNGLLSLNKLDGTSISTSISTSSNLLINSTKIVSASGTINWSVPFSSVTSPPSFNDVYNNVFGVPYTINMNTDAGKYIELTIDGTVQGTYDQNRFYRINLVDRNLDGDSFFLKINSPHNTPSYVSSRTETSILGNNNLYLYTYSTGTTSWHPNLIQQDKYTQLINTNGYYNNFIFSGFTSSLTTSSYTLSTVGVGHVLTLEQPGKYIINYNFGNTDVSIWLPSATTYPYQELEIQDITIPNSATLNYYNKKRIFGRYNQRIYTLGSSNELQYFTLNEQNLKYVKFMSNGTDWILTHPINLFSSPLSITPRFSTNGAPSYQWTATTTTNYGSCYIDNGVCKYNFEIQSKVKTTNQLGSDLSIMLPFEAASTNNFYTGLPSVVLMTSAGTLTTNTAVSFNGSSIPSNLRFIKTEFPSRTYYTWGDLANETFLIKGSVEYGITQAGGNTFKMFMDSFDIETYYTGYYF